MKKLLFIISFVFPAISFSQTTYVPDDGFESRLIQLGLDSGPLDDLVLTGNINDLEEFDFGNFVVTNITGIEDFIALKDLRVDGEISDLSPLEGLINLEVLFIDEVLDTSFDLSVLTNLKSLFIDDSAITSLNFTNNINLIELSIEESDVNEVIFGNHVNLEDVWLTSTAIVNADFSGCTRLKNLYINYNNVLNKVNVTQNALLETIELYESPLLKSLDLSKNTELIRVEAQDNTALETIFIKNGNNTNIGQSFLVKDNPVLSCVEVDDVDWSNIYWNFSTDSFSGFSESCSLSNIINIPDPNFEQALIDLNIDSDGIINGQVLSIDIENVTYLDVNSKQINNLVGIEGFTALETLFAHNNSIANIDISNNMELTGLVLAKNQISSIDLSKNTKLVSLSLNENALTSLNVSLNTTLKQIYVDDNQLTVLNLETLRDLEELSVANNSLSALEVYSNSNLRILNCSNNQISELNTLSNLSLESLNCQQNNIEYLDLSQNISLLVAICNDNNLEGLNIKNGNSTSILNEDFSAFANPNLMCINVDDASYSSIFWSQVDMQTSFSENCSPVNDDCDFTIPIVLAQDTPGSTLSASNSGRAPNCVQNGITVFDVWYSFAAPASGSITITINASPLVGNIALYNSCSDVQPVYCDSNELMVSGLTPNQTYYLQVWLELSASDKSAISNKAFVETGSFSFKVQDAATLSLNKTLVFVDQISIYPNPANSFAKIVSNENFNALELYNTSGQLIYKKEDIKSKEHTINLNRLNPGVYFIKIHNHAQSLVKKLIVK